MAWTVLWWMLTRFPTKIPATAPTAHQLSDVLWGEITAWHRKMHPWLREQLDVKSDKIELRSSPKESFAVARTARPEQPEAFQGFHSANLLFLIDEASGVEDVIFEVGEGALSTPGAKVLMAGNPTRPSGYFYDAFTRGRASWYTMRVSCADSSRVAPRYLEEMAARYGKDSNVYRVRVLGEFPTAADNAVIPLELAEAAAARDVQAYGPVVWGVDVARFGDDRTAVIKRKGNVILEPATTWRGKDLMQTVGLIHRMFSETPPLERPTTIAVDVIGIGAGVVDRARELGLPVIGINVAESASVDDRYMRLRDELWFKARRWLEARDCKLPADETLIGELATPTYTITSSGKIKVEGKDELKKRGVDSPDVADAFCLSLAVVPQIAITESLEPEVFND